MKWTSPLVTGILLKRYKRFLVDVRLENGDVVTAHCANTGAMLGLPKDNAQVLVFEALQAGNIPELHGYDAIKREATIGKSRLDFKLSKTGLPDCYVEVKNCHLKRTENTLEFPDGVTSRGAKHLEELVLLKQQGLRAVMLYIGQRNDCTAFKVAADLDPEYAEAFTAAHQAGVEMLCYDCVLTTETIQLGKKLRVIG